MFANKFYEEDYTMYIDNYGFLLPILGVVASEIAQISTSVNVDALCTK